MALSLPGGWREGQHARLMIYVRDLRDPQTRRQRIYVRHWWCIKDVKDHLQAIISIPSTKQRLFRNGKELKNIRTLQECGIYNDGEALWFTIAQQNIGNAMIHTFGEHKCSAASLKVIHKAQQGLALGYAPELSMDGTGATYFLRDARKRRVGCFKPYDEEAFAPLNPRGVFGQLGDTVFQRGILSGEACEREVAAYLLDKDHFAGVPATVLVEVKHPVFNYGGQPIHFKLGSLQEFVRHDDLSSDYAPGRYSVDNVHRIAVLDIRLLNTDRNEANLLVRKERAEDRSIRYKLIPIDHGYCLPNNMKISTIDWCWYTWPQLKKPLSPTTISYILNLDLEAEAKELSQKLSISPICIRNMRVLGMLLKKGVQAGLTLYDIARIICREELEEKKSILEQLCDRALRHSTHGESLAEKEMAVDVPKISIDIDLINAASKNAPSSGAASPPGFWASKSPWTRRDSPTNRQRDLNSWDTMCSDALQRAGASKHDENLTQSPLHVSRKSDSDRLFLSSIGSLLDVQIQEMIDSK